MAKRTRESYERERQARARADLARASVSGRYGNQTGMAGEAEIARLDLLNDTPSQYPFVRRIINLFPLILLVALIGFFGYLFMEYL